MREADRLNELEDRDVPLAMNAKEFREAGYALIDAIADFMQSLPDRPVTAADTPERIHALLGDRPVPETGMPAGELLGNASKLLFEHSLFNAHPRFWGYITSSPAPVGILGELLAAAVNQNVGAWTLAPLASGIEKQTIRWIAELLGYPASCGGLLVSGGNMANFVGFLAARRAKLPWDTRTKGLCSGNIKLAIYASKETHTWIQKAADMFGLGIDAVRWIPADSHCRMNIDALEKQIETDKQAGVRPFFAVGTAGTVGVGAIDPLPEIAEICKRHNIWFHVDGAYGAPAAMLPEAPAALKSLSLADSVAVDPHKWLYDPIDAGCVLVRNPAHLLDAFSFNPDYYSFEKLGGQEVLNYYELGPQNTRGFRALKVWLALNAAGRDGYVRMIRDDIALSKALYELVQQEGELEAKTQSLSIATFRYRPLDFQTGNAEEENYLNELNRELMTRIQEGGKAFVSNAVIDGSFFLRACIVNFQTRLADIKELVKIVLETGRELDAVSRPVSLKNRSG